MPHIFPNSSQRPFPKMAGKGPGSDQTAPMYIQYCWKSHIAGLLMPDPLTV